MPTNVHFDAALCVASCKAEQKFLYRLLEPGSDACSFCSVGIFDEVTDVD